MYMTCQQRGGAIAVWSYNGIGSIRNTTFSNNDGGGIDSTGGSLDLAGCVFSQNSAAGSLVRDL
jgi:hypothetical protein